MDNLNNPPDFGAGPYGVEYSEDTTGYYLTLRGVRTGKVYTLGKTACRAARQLNTGLRDVGFLEEAQLHPAKSGVVKKKTYLLKCECKECGLIFRATAKTLNGKTLRCPDDDCIGDVEVEGAEDTGE